MEWRKDDRLGKRISIEMEYRSSGYLVGPERGQDHSVLLSQMKIVKLILGAALGGVIATVLCWGSLILFAIFILHGEGSLFDTNPTAANAFFISWATISVLFMVLGVSITVRIDTTRKR